MILASCLSLSLMLLFYKNQIEMASLGHRDASHNCLFTIVSSFLSGSHAKVLNYHMNTLHPILNG